MKIGIYLLLSVVATGLYSCISQPNIDKKAPELQYVTKVTFCDSRQPDTVILDYEPYSSDIRTYKLAVPVWGGYLNVCALNVIRIDTLK